MGKSLKILFTEDTSEYGRNCAGVLRSYGFEVKPVPKDGEAVLAAVGAESFDVIILDAFLLHIDALGIMKSLSRLNLQKKPVVMLMSGVDNARFEEDALAAGADYYFLKPVSAEILAERILQFTSWRKPGRENLVLTGNSQDLEVIISDTMHQIGVPAHIKGYQNYGRQ